VAEIGVDDQGLVLDPRVGGLLGSLDGLISVAEKVQQQVDELEWSDSAAHQAFLRTDEKTSGTGERK
jgi:hypothetical protein